MKITFINEMADLCEAVGADVQQVARGIGLDERIGGKFLHAGPGYGGSCFPKDTLALVRTARDAGAPVELIETTVEVNDARKKAMAGKVVAALGGDLTGKTVGVLGLTFKPNTDDMRDAPVAGHRAGPAGGGRQGPGLRSRGRTRRASCCADVDFKDDPYDAAEGADVAGDHHRVGPVPRAGPRPDQAADERSRCWSTCATSTSPTTCAPRGFAYTSVGRPRAESKRQVQALQPALDHPPSERQARRSEA